MIKSPSFLTKTMSMLTVAAAVLAFHAQPAEAQAAKKLSCKGCVKSKQLKNGGIRANDIGDGAVTGSKIAADTIPATDLQNEAGANFSSGDQNEPLDATDEIVRSVSITAPTSGIVIVNASGNFNLGSTGRDSGRCSITTGTSFDDTHRMGGGDLGVETSRAGVPFGGSRGFNVSAGTTAFNLVCFANDGVVSVIDSSLTAMFFPTAY